MRFTAEKKRKVELYILEKILQKDPTLTSSVAEALDLNQATVHSYVNDLLDRGIIKRVKRGAYELNDQEHWYHLERTDGSLVFDDLVYSEYVEKHLSSLPENVKRIWNYAFSEMINNVIDHSESESADILVRQNYLSTTIMIRDYGVGIFGKIKEYFNLSSLDEAVSELFKGKITTDAKNHSGEGIFFTSKMVDTFYIVSDGKVFTNNVYDDSITYELGEGKKGTTVIMELSNFSNKTAREVFDLYADVDGGFVKTVLPIKNIFDTDPISRSQAKRLCNRLESYKEVVFDFNGVQWMGQGFAHQVFVVFADRNKGIKLTPINMNEDVERMYKHVFQG